MAFRRGDACWCLLQPTDWSIEFEAERDEVSHDLGSVSFRRSLELVVEEFGWFAKLTTEALIPRTIAL